MQTWSFSKVTVTKYPYLLLFSFFFSPFSPSVLVLFSPYYLILSHIRKDMIVWTRLNRKVREATNRHILRFPHPYHLSQSLTAAICEENRQPAQHCAQTLTHKYQSLEYIFGVLTMFSTNHISARSQTCLHFSTGQDRCLYLNEGNVHRLLGHHFNFKIIYLHFFFHCFKSTKSKK